MEIDKRINQIFIYVVLFVTACTHEASQENVEVTIKFKESIDAARSQKNHVLDMASVAFFPWDSLFIFKAYSPIETIQSSVGFEWAEADRTLIHQSDEFNLLVFIRHGKVVSYVKIPRNYGDFSKLDSSGPFTPHNALFNVRQEYVGNQLWVFLYAAKKHV